MWNPLQKNDVDLYRSSILLLILFKVRELGMNFQSHEKFHLDDSPDNIMKISFKVHRFLNFGAHFDICGPKTVKIVFLQNSFWAYFAWKMMKAKFIKNQICNEI